MPSASVPAPAAAPDAGLRPARPVARPQHQHPAEGGVHRPPRPAPGVRSRHPHGSPAPAAPRAATHTAHAAPVREAIQAPFRAPKWLRPWAALPIGGAVLAALLAYAGPGALVHAFREASPGFIVLAGVAYGWFFVLRGLRWAFLLRGGGMQPGGFVLPAALESMAWMISTFLPFKAGDAVRAVVLSRRRDAPLAAVAGTVAMERALDLAGLALAASIGLGVLAWSDVAIPERWAPVVALAWVLPVAGLGSAFLLALLVRRKPRTSMPLRLLGQLLDGILGIARHRRLALPAIAWTVAIKGTQILVYLCLLNAFLPGAPALAAAVVPLFLLSFLVALTPGHVGTYEAAFVIVFSLVGLPAAQLAGAAVAVHLTAIALVCVLGSLSLAYITASGRGARRRAGLAATRPAQAPAPLEAREAAR